MRGSAVIVAPVTDTPRRRPPTPLLVVALGIFVLLGALTSVLGVAWPSMMEVFARPVSDLGSLLAFTSVTFVSAAVLYGRMHERVGTGRLIGSGSVVVVVGLIAAALAPSWPVLVVSSLLLGLGSGLLDTGVNAHSALTFDVRSINLLHACFGLGATLGPAVITLSLTATGAWRAGYVALALVQVVAVVAIWARQRDWVDPDVRTSEEAAGVLNRLRLFLLLAIFFLYTGVEVAAGQWAFTLLSEERGMSTAAAGVWVAAYWGGLTVARLALGAIGHRFSIGQTLGWSMAIALVGLAVLWADPGGVGFIGLPITGVGFAAVFPALIAVTPARMGPSNSTRAIGYQFAAATLGVATIPWVLGVVAENACLQTLAPGLFLFTVLEAAVIWISGREAARDSRVSETSTIDQV